MAGVERAGKAAAPLADLPRRSVEALVGTWVRDVRLYRRALTAPGAVSDPLCGSYERLEYLGDAVLSAIVREYIFAKCGPFPLANSSACSLLLQAHPSCLPSHGHLLSDVPLPYRNGACPAGGAAWVSTRPVRCLAWSLGECMLQVPRRHGARHVRNGERPGQRPDAARLCSSPAPRPLRGRQWPGPGAAITQHALRHRMQPVKAA